MKALFLVLLILSTTAIAQVPLELKCLWAAYKTFKISSSSDEIIFPNGVVLPFKAKEPGGYPADPQHLTSISQMFLVPYNIGFGNDGHGHLTYPIPTVREYLRGKRYTKLFYELYGHSEGEVVQDLVRVRWIDGSSIVFNRNYGAASALQLISNELVSLLRVHPEFRKYLRQPIGGTFNWRPVAGENNISSHAFGIAIDINTDYADYWLWETGADGIIHYRNRIPPEIAQVFERHGFIWGGKWYHYDTMHFEFRPELMMSAATCEKEFQKYGDTALENLENPFAPETP